MALTVTDSAFGRRILYLTLTDFFISSKNGKSSTTTLALTCLQQSSPVSLRKKMQQASRVLVLVPLVTTQLRASST